MSGGCVVGGKNHEHDHEQLYENVAGRWGQCASQYRDSCAGEE